MTKIGDLKYFVTPHARQRFRERIKPYKKMSHILEYVMRRPDKVHCVWAEKGDQRTLVTCWLKTGSG